jgi:hypothetical protein
VVVSVRWNNSYSHTFAVLNGARQRSILSPTLIDVLINVCIVRLRSLGVGCKLFVLSRQTNIKGLQSMLVFCAVTSKALSLSFKAAKSYCLAVGELSNILRTPSLLGNDNVHVVKVVSIKYFRITITGGIITRLSQQHS